MALPEIDWHGMLPFILSTGQTQRLSVARITEAIIIAALTGGGVMWATQQVMGEQIEGLRSDVQKLEQRMERFQRDFYAPRVGPDFSRSS